MCTKLDRFTVVTDTVITKHTWGPAPGAKQASGTPLVHSWNNKIKIRKKGNKIFIDNKT
jgi:hypothetical protein